MHLTPLTEPSQEKNLLNICATKGQVNLRISVTVKPVLRDHKQYIYIYISFQTGGCLLLDGSSAESLCMTFLY